MKNFWAHTFLLSQGRNSTRVFFHTAGDKWGFLRGLWKSERPGFDFLDTSDHDQWILHPVVQGLRAANSIGLREVEGAGHLIDFSESASRAFTLHDVPRLSSIHRPASGEGEMHFTHSQVLQPGPIEWEYQATTLVTEWAVDD